MARRKLQLNPSRTARRGRASSAAATDGLMTVEVREPISGLDISARPGDIIELPQKTAERYVELGVVIYAISPAQRAVQTLHDLGCGIALPPAPPDEVQAAIGAVGARTAAL